MRRPRTTAPGALLVAAALLLALPACSDDDSGSATSDTAAPEGSDAGTDEDAATTEPAPAPASTTTSTLVPDQLPGMPPVLDVDNVYSEAGTDELSDAVSEALPLVYVPTNVAGNVTVIDPETFEVVGQYQLGELVQHVVPDWDLGTLYANVSAFNTLVPFDPTTGEPGTGFRIDAPYNLYFSPDGEHAIVMAERRNRIDYYERETWEPVTSIDVPCEGPNHADWSVDGQFFVVTCEFSGQMLKVDTASGEPLDVLDLGSGSRPQDVRLGPDGTTFYIADLAADRVQLLDAESFEIVGSIPTGDGPHSVYPSRDASVLYVANRDGGTVSVVDPSTNTVVDTWVIPGGGSPDMGGVSADGSTLWLSGRSHDEVYAFDTATGELAARIPVAGEPHGIAVWPQPGRYSLGHTGNTR